MRYFLIAAGLAIGYWGYTYLHKSATLPAAQSGQPPATPAPLAPEALDKPPPPVFDEKALEKIRASTADSDPKVRWEAAQFLANARDPQADAILLNILRADESAELRRNVIGLLAGRGDGKFTQHILSSLKDTDVDVRLSALSALSQIGDYATAPAISEALRDSDERVRLAALKTLSDLQAKRNAQVQKIEEQRKAYREQMQRQAEKGKK